MLKPRPLRNLSQSTTSSRTKELDAESIRERFDQMNAKLERLEKHMSDMKEILDKLVDE
jgi:DNA repair exonuclease SbcCD ATPase subunit